jgi:hypothetical protein
MNESICKARHSHSITSWKNYIIISGGLDNFENPLNDIILFDCVKFETKRIELNKGNMLPRYLKFNLKPKILIIIFYH